MRDLWRVAMAGAVLALVGGAMLAAWLHRRTTAYDHVIGQAAARHRLDIGLVKSLIYEESWFRPRIRGSAGELGLMQVSMAAAADFADRKGFPAPTESRLLEPELNIEIGTWYLRQSLDRYRDSPAPLVFALLRYNAGETRADQWLKQARSRAASPGMSVEDHCLSVVDFPKTRAYARRIVQRYRTGRIWF